MGLYRMPRGTSGAAGHGSEGAGTVPGTVPPGAGTVRLWASASALDTP